MKSICFVSVLILLFCTLTKLNAQASEQAYDPSFDYYNLPELFYEMSVLNPNCDLTSGYEHALQRLNGNVEKVMPLSHNIKNLKIEDWATVQEFLFSPEGYVLEMVFSNKRGPTKNMKDAGYKYLYDVQGRKLQAISWSVDNTNDTIWKHVEYIYDNLCLSELRIFSLDDQLQEKYTIKRINGKGSSVTVSDKNGSKKYIKEYHYNESNLLESCLIIMESDIINYEWKYDEQNLRTAIFKDNKLYWTFKRNSKGWVKKESMGAYHTTHYKYDKKGLLKKHIIPGQRGTPIKTGKATYAYNDRGLLKSITQTNHKIYGETPVANYSYEYYY